MTTELMIALVGSGTTILSSVISWALAKKKYYTETETSIIENMEKSLEFYKKLSDDNRTRLEEAIERNKALEKEVQELKKQVLNLALNICTDLTCDHRRDGKKNKRLLENITYVEKKDRVDETKGPSRRRCESTQE